MIESGNMFENGKKLLFLEILSKIPYNDLDWYIFELSAVGVAPNNISMVEFEKNINKSENGYKISWHELLDFAKKVDDIDTIVLVASKYPITFNEINTNDNIFAYVEIFDSSTWKIIQNIMFKSM